MDRAEAIGVLTIEQASHRKDGLVDRAIDMAIAALREQDVTDINDGRKTNADCIRAMTDEELAHWICKRLPSCSVESCPGAELCNGTDGPSNGLVKWLQQPCGGADHA